MAKPRSQSPQGRRESSQARGARTQTALLDAAEALILADGLDAASIGAIASRAGCSVGTLYHHFKDKQALLYALFERIIDTYADAFRAAAAPDMWTGASVRDLVAGYIDFILAMSARKANSPSVVALILAEHPDWRGRLTAMQAESRGRVVELILARRDEIGRLDADGATRFVVDQLAAMLAARSDPAQQDSAVSDLGDDGFRAEAVRLAEAYLQLKPAPTGPASP